MQKKLTRSTNNQILGGVCAGLADYINIDPTLVRLLFAALFLLKGGGVLIYLLLWIIMPTTNSAEELY